MLFGIFQSITVQNNGAQIHNSPAQAESCTGRALFSVFMQVQKDNSCTLRQTVETVAATRAAVVKIYF